MKRILIIAFVALISVFFMGDVAQAETGRVSKAGQIDTVQLHGSKDYGKGFNPNNFAGSRKNSVVLQGTSTMIITRGADDAEAAGPLVDGVTCEGNSETNYTCSSDFVSYGCTEECQCCFYEERNDSGS